MGGGMLPPAVVALLLLALTTIPARATREIATFDFGWRWRLGLHGVPHKDAPPEPPSTGPGPNPPEAAVAYDDSAWAAVHLPHDGLISQGANNVSCPTGCSGRSFIPRHVMWYRKSFTLPPRWTGGADNESSVWVEFDGVFHAAIVYLNGAVVARNAEGYLGFRVPLDNATLRGGAGEKNVLAVFVDPDGGGGFSQVTRSGWWYEGAGIYRHARVVRSAPVRVARDGLVARSQLSGLAPRGAARTTVAAAAVLSLSATIENAGATAAAAGVEVSFSLVDKHSGAVVGRATSGRSETAATEAPCPPFPSLC
jgi:beta-galactosidase